MKNEIPDPIPDGTRIYKCNAKPDDGHKNGASGVVQESIGPIPFMGQMVYGYMVRWDDMPKIPVFITGTRITVQQPSLFQKK